MKPLRDYMENTAISAQKQPRSCHSGALHLQLQQRGELLGGFGDLVPFAGLHPFLLEQAACHLLPPAVHSAVVDAGGHHLVLIPEDADAVVEALRAAGETANIIGEVVKSDTERVILEEK